MNGSLPAINRARTWTGVGIAVALPTLVTVAYFVLAAHYSSTAQRTTYLVMKCLEFAFPVLWVWAVEREAIRLWRPRNAGIGLGLAFGLAVATATWVLYHEFLRGTPFFTAGAENMRAKVQGFGIDRAWKFIAFGAFYSFGHALLEEYYFRWFIFGRLRRLLTLWPAIVISAFGFMAHHVLVLAIYFGWLSPATVLLSLAIAIGGGFWAWLYDRAGSLAGPCLSHLLVDAGIFLVGFDIMRDMFAGVSP